ncbi:polysaccharide lyase family 4-like protein [Kribbella sp. VKM Ac-2569]|uniref:polysaccharide lyase family protein n=1 Tax=Kribbella sp. VKM Ac-2569 TaxID=2512220 RepID=UPI00102B2839|nr:polysaccharide lyase family protein [Kribbella sp. VKM Ac-2569]RZT15106.1 polysaccharide lyase family 4-like protein [Kribbella sp. VKM Ac-2569]
MRRPPAITGLHGAGGIRIVTLDWKPVSWATVVDHYAVYADGTLIGKTVYPHFVHRGLDFTGVTRSYSVVTVDAAGNRSAQSAAAAVANLTSVTISGTPIATVGTFDGKGSELALSPKGYAEYPTRFPSDVDYTFGTSTPSADWSYLLPGPGDKWAGTKNHRATFRFDLPAVPEQDLDLALWLIDSHASLAASALLTINGTEAGRLTFANGATKGSTIADSTYPGSPLKPSYLELPLPKALFRSGQNVLEIFKDQGSWIAYDALGVFARR